MLLFKMAFEEVSFQTAAEDWATVMIAMGSAFHSFGARSEKSFGCVERWPGVFSEGTNISPASADLRAREGL